MFEQFKASRRLKDVEERLETVERDFKRLRLEWEDSYDKLRTLMQRIAKRAQAVEKAQETANESDIPSESPSLPLDPVSARILARRNRLGRLPQ
jgi:hypothetical protein